MRTTRVDCPETPWLIRFQQAAAEAELGWTHHYRHHPGTDRRLAWLCPTGTLSRNSGPRQTYHQRPWQVFSPRQRTTSVALVAPRLRFPFALIGTLCIYLCTAHYQCSIADLYRSIRQTPSQAMDADTLIQRTSNTCLMWYFLTSNTLTAIDPNLQPDRYADLTVTKAMVYRTLLDYQSLEEYVCRPDMMWTPALIREIHNYSMLKLAQHMVDNRYITEYQKRTGLILITLCTTDNQNEMVDVVDNTNLMPVVRAANVMRDEENVSEYTLCTIGDYCFYTLFGNDDHGGWCFITWNNQAMDRIEKCFACINFIRQWPMAFLRAWLFATISGNIREDDCRTILRHAYTSYKIPYEMPEKEVQTRFCNDPATTNTRMGRREKMQAATPLFTQADEVIEEGQRVFVDLFPNPH